MVSQIPRSGTLVPTPSTPMVGSSSQLDLSGEADVDTLFKHLWRSKGTCSQLPQLLDPTLRHPNPSVFRVLSLLHKCRRCTSKNPGINFGAKLHPFLFARLNVSLSCTPYIATSRIGTGRLCGKQPTPFICRPSNANAIRRWRGFISSANSGDRDPDPDGKSYCNLSLRG